VPAATCPPKSTGRLRHRADARQRSATARSSMAGRSAGGTAAMDAVAQRQVAAFVFAAIQVAKWLHWTSVRNGAGASSMCEPLFEAPVPSGG